MNFYHVYARVFLEVIEMADYKSMYKHLFQQTERAVRIIQQAQLDCEEIYINTPEPRLVPLEKPEEPKPKPEPESEPDFPTGTDVPL